MKQLNAWLRRSLNVLEISWKQPPLRIALALVLVVASAMLLGCASAPLVEVPVPVPVECRAQLPSRPAMPTEGLQPGGKPSERLLQRVKALMAEIEIREGYELRLVATLQACLRPIAQPVITTEE